MPLDKIYRHQRVPFLALVLIVTRVWWPRSAIAFFLIFLVFIFNLFILLKIKNKIKTKLTKNRFKTKLKQKQTKIVIKLKLKQNKTQNVLGPGV